jgi:hypothetical protein
MQQKFLLFLCIFSLPAAATAPATAPATDPATDPAPDTAQLMSHPPCRHSDVLDYQIMFGITELIFALCKNGGEGQELTCNELGGQMAAACWETASQLVCQRRISVKSLYFSRLEILTSKVRLSAAVDTPTSIFPKVTNPFTELYPLRNMKHFA